MLPTKKVDGGPATSTRCRKIERSDGVAHTTMLVSTHVAPIAAARSVGASMLSKSMRVGLVCLDIDRDGAKGSDVGWARTSIARIAQRYAF